MLANHHEVGIFWDFGSCPAPSELTGYTVVHNIRSLALRFGNIKSFRAYLSICDHSSTVTTSRSHLLRSQLQSSGVSLTDIPGEKQVADKMLIVDMLAYAFDRPSDSTVIVLISADSTLAYALSILRFRAHHIVIISPAETRLDLIVQASLSFDWNIEIIGSSPSAAAETPQGNIRAKVDSPLVSESHPADGLSPRSQALASPSNGKSYIAPEDNFPEPQVTNSPSTSAILTPEIIPQLPVVAPLEPDGLIFDIDPPGLAQPRAETPASEPPPLSFVVENNVLEPDLTSVSEEMSQGGSSASQNDPPRDPLSFPALKFHQSTASPHSSAISNYIYLGERPPSYSSSSSIPFPPNREFTPEGKKKKKNIPPGFELLIAILQGHRAEGIVRPRRSVVALQLVSSDPQLYQKIGVTRFAQYSAMAVSLGLVEIGGSAGDAWISLHPIVYE